MKKMLLILALAVFSFANAQKGSILVMGSFSYQSVTTESNASENKDDYFSFAPKVGYQFHENWTAGIEASTGTYKSKDDLFLVIKTNDFSVGGFIRYTKPLNETFSFYTDLGLGFQNHKESNGTGSGSTSTIKADGIYVGVTPAVLINVGKGFGLNFNIGGLKYSTLSYGEGSISNIDSIKRFNFNLGQSITIGISKNF